MSEDVKTPEERMVTLILKSLTVAQDELEKLADELRKAIDSDFSEVDLNTLTTLVEVATAFESGARKSFGGLSLGPLMISVLAKPPAEEAA